MENTDMISRDKALKAIKNELTYQEDHATPGEDIDTGIICGLRQAAKIVKGIAPVKNTQAAPGYYPEQLSEKVNGFKDGYMDGFEAGRKAKEQAVVIIKCQQYYHPADLEMIRRNIVNAKEQGVIMLTPDMEYIGTIPKDAEIKLVAKELPHEKN